MLLAMSLLPALVPAADEDGLFQVITAETRLVDQVYRLNARLELQLSDAARQALDNGVALVLDWQVEVNREYDWSWWGFQVAELQQRYQLQYHALSQRFVVRNLNTGEQTSYRSLPDALAVIGAIRDFPMLDQRVLDKGKPYRARLRVVLDIESLPTPMRLWAYTSSQWRLKSEWYTWPLRH